MGLQDDARKFGVHINVGVHEPAEGGKKIKNTLLWIDDKGGIAQRYQKLHLYDVYIKTGPVLRESDSVEPGNKLLEPFDTPVGKVGLGICFDVRTCAPLTMPKILALYLALKENELKQV